MSTVAIPDHDSHIPWLGEIPAHWDTVRNRFLFREVDQRSKDGSETHLSMSQIHGLVPSASIDSWRLKSESYAGGKLCAENDLVLNRLKAHLGVFARASQAGVVSPDYTVLRPVADISVPYFEYLFKTPPYIANLACATRGIVEGFWRLYTDDFYGLRSIVPPRREQDAIVSFLDGKLAEIDRFIANKRRLIELLEEEQKGVITRIIHCGLDENALTTNSQIERIGEVPEHWVISRLKYVITFQRGHDLPTERRTPGEFPLVTSAGPTDTHNVSATSGPGIVTGRYGTIGKFYLVPTSYWPLNTTLYSIDLHGNCVEYLHYMLQTLEQLFLMYSAKSAVPGVDRNDIHQISVAIPPSTTEQNAIAKLITNRVAHFRSGIAEIEKEIELMNEFRRSLIAEAVTGKIDVSGFSSNY